VVCLGHILDEEGRKMSKHLGNVLEPIPFMDAHGADAVRWFMLASGSPWQARRVGHNSISEVVRKTLLTYWNTVSFQSLYARTAQWSPSASDPAPTDRPLIDQWVLSGSNRLARDVDNALDQFDTQRAGRLIATFIDDLSNWYVRRSRRRFWDGDPAALATLHEALRTVTLCMAPFTPFITERVWQDLFRSTDPQAPGSVHLSSWPESSEALIDDRLESDMALVRRLVELGRAARADSGVRTRQPLGRALISASGWNELSPDLRAQIAEELNVWNLEGLGDNALVNLSVKANFRSLGQRFAKDTPAIATAIADADAAALVASIRATGSGQVTVAGFGEIEVAEDDLVITETPQEGWTVASDAGESVALDLAMNDELISAGLARELIRALQEGRKTSGLDITDRIHIFWTSSDEILTAAFVTHESEIADDVLAVQVSNTSAPSEATVIATELPIDLAIIRAV
jgi:isoleucyl-tRNA synthetase